MMPASALCAPCMASVSEGRPVMGYRGSGDCHGLSTHLGCSMGFQPIRDLHGVPILA
jgi:hypothetical protein